MHIVPITGATKFRINMDPSVWIFDKRKIELDTYIQTGQHTYVKEREAAHSYGIPFAPFLKNAQPKEEAKQVICHLKDDQEVVITLEKAQQSILAFAKDGQPLQEEGPVQLYFGGDQYDQTPISQIVCFEVTT